MKFRTGVFSFLFGLFGVQATAQSPLPPGSAPSHQAALRKIAVDECPGVEHFLPGVYYYCVGRRAFARQNYPKARSMYEIASAWGSKQAQFMLGIGYFKGDAGVLNRPLGLAWLALSAERGTPYFVAVLRSAEKHASAQEKASADRLLATMRAKYGDARAAHRAYRRYRAFQNELTSAEAYGGQFCIDGLTTNRLGFVGARSAGDFHEAFTVNHGDVVAAGTPISEKPEKRSASCAGQQPAAVVAKMIEPYADVLFERWEGHVTVGALETVPAPSAPDSRH